MSHSVITPDSGEGKVMTASARRTLKRAVQLAIAFLAVLASSNLVVDPWRETVVLAIIGALFTLGYHGQALSGNLTMRDALTKAKLFDALFMGALVLLVVLSISS